MTLRRFNNALSVAVILLGIYIAAAPFLPQLIFQIDKINPPANAGAPYAGQLAGTSDNRQPTPQDNRIVIPSIGLDEPIKTGNTILTLNNGGTWLRPSSANPSGNGNTVIVGHRFWRSQASTFFHLDKVKIGDRIGVYWEGMEIVYKVTETKVVPATAFEIESQTKDKRLTLYTCTPLWTSKDRLVIVALPEATE